MAETKQEQQPISQEVFPDKYVFEAIERLRGVSWGNLLYPTVIHSPYMKHRIHADVIDSESGLIYHLSTHPSFLDLAKNTDFEDIPGYGSREGWITSPLVSLINRQTQFPTHRLMANFEPRYYWPRGYGLKYVKGPITLPQAPEAQLKITGIDDPSPEEELEFKELFERLCPLE